MRLFSQVVSWVLMPILMPVYGLLLVMYTPSQPLSSAYFDSLYLFDGHNKIVILSYFLFFSAIMPVLVYLFLKNMHVIRTIQLDDKNERTSPMIFVTVFCLILFYLLVSAGAILPKYTYALSLSGAIIIGIFTYVNKFMKVSLHAAGAGILTGFVFAYVWEQMYFKIWILSLVLLISGIVLSSRLYLEKHTPKELIVGYFFSLFTTFVLNLFFPLELMMKIKN